jgi:hypothetical protein
VEDGKPRTIPGLPSDAIPRGWARNGQLWVTRGGDRAGVPARLTPPLDVATGEALEEHAVAPVDLTGWLGMALGHLYVLHGLPEAR